MSRMWRVEWILPDGNKISVHQVRTDRAVDAIFMAQGELGSMAAGMVKGAKAIVVEEVKKTDILAEMRDAFDGDDVPRKNVMLRRAYDEITILRAKLKLLTKGKS